MKYGSKVRMSIGWVYPIGIFTSYILLLLEHEARKILGTGNVSLAGIPSITIIMVSVMFIVLGIIQWKRYRNWRYPVLGFLFGIMTGQVAFVWPHYDDPGIFGVTYFICFILTVLFVIINWSSLYAHERYEMNSRRLFRLAASCVTVSDSGYTSRPYPGGKTECTRDELLGFSRFLHGNYIARPYYSEKSVCIAFSMNKSLLVSDDGMDVSHVIIGYDGTITVWVSDKDYRDYSERLSFDRLCQAFSDIFGRFLDYYRQGLESRIVAELKSAR